MQAAFHSQPNGVCRATAAAAAFAGVLDDYTTALAAAYLPFRGFASYEGNGFTIRDTVGDAEQDVGFDAVTGELNAYTVGGNAAVATWFDQSSNANDLLQATAAAQPLHLTSAINSKGGLDLDGTSHYMESTAAMSFASGFSVYVVLKHDVDSAWQTIFCESNWITTRLRKRADNNYLQLTVDPNDDLGSTSLGTNAFLLSVVISGSATKSWLNAVADVSTGFGTTAANQKYRIGLDGSGSWYMDGKIAALLAYNAVHNDTTRGEIETILADYFGIAL